MNELLLKWFEKIGIKKFISYLSYVKYYYYRPKYFITTFNDYTNNEIFKRFSVYYLIVYLFVYFLLPNTNFRDLIGLFLKLLFLTLITIIPIALTSKIITKDWNLKKIAIFLLGLNAFFVPLIIIFHNYFISSEFYIFYFAQNIIFLWFIIYIIVIICGILVKRLKRILLAIFLNIILFNLFALPAFITEFFYRDEINFLDDPIYSEYKQSIDRLQIIQKYPVNRVIVTVLNRKPGYTFCAMSFNDSICKSTNESNLQYIKSVDSELKIINQIEKENLKFITTKKQISLYKNFIEQVKYEIDFRYDKIPSNLKTDILVDSIGRPIGATYISYINNSKMTSSLISFNIENNRIINSSEYSCYPLAGVALFALPIALYSELEYMIGDTIIDKKDVTFIKPE